MSEPDAASRRLAALLRERREDLIQRWTERVLHDPRLGDVNRLTEPELHDHIPEIIDELSRLLEEEKASEACGRDLGSSEAAIEHARHRLRSGFQLAEALREFSHFRAALIEVCAEAGEPLDADAAELVHATVDQNMITGAAEMERAKLAELDQQAAFRERFVGIVGHDLRTPLHSIRLAIDVLLRRADTTPDQSRVLQRAAASADRMGRMIHELLDLTRARLGSGIPIERRPTDLDAVCRQAIDELSLTHPSRTIELDAPVPARGAYDPDRVAQIVANLVGNALDHGLPDAPVRVTVREAEGEAILSVHNRGPAIAADSLPHLFDPFWRGRPREGTGESLGLGLFIVKQIVDAHGGSIEVTSTPEGGTTIAVHLPRGG